MIMQRAISRRRWCPYDSVPAGRFATDVSPIRSSHTAARSSASFSARRYAGVENRPGSSPAFTLRCCATSRFSTTVSDEQADVLERAHRALQRDLVARQPANRVAVEHDVAAGRLVEAADAVEHRGLARAVRPDDREHLIATHVEIDPVHREQPAEAHLQPGDLQQFRIRAHWGSSTWGRLAGSRPCGRHIIINTITRPKISIRYSAKPRATSGSTVSRIAARITPSCGSSRRARRSRGSAPIR